MHVHVLHLVECKTYVVSTISFYGNTVEHDCIWETIYHALCAYCACGWSVRAIWPILVLDLHLVLKLLTSTNGSPYFLPIFLQFHNLFLQELQPFFRMLQIIHVYIFKTSVLTFSYMPNIIMMRGIWMVLSYPFANCPVSICN